MCIQDKKQRLEPDMEQWTGLKLGKEYIKAVYCHSAYLTCMQNTSCGNARLDESQAGVEIVGRNINSLRYAADTLMGASLVAQTVKKKKKNQPICIVGDLGSILGWEDPLEEGMATQYSCLENSKYRGAWRAIAWSYLSPD